MIYCLIFFPFPFGPGPPGAFVFFGLLVAFLGDFVFLGALVFFGDFVALGALVLDLPPGPFKYRRFSTVVSDDIDLVTVSAEMAEDEKTTNKSKSICTNW